MMSYQEIKNILDELINLLFSVREKNWHDGLKVFRERCDYSSITGNQSLLSEILGIYGGMGSFSDLVLYKDGKLLKDETSQLDDLRKKLFEAVLKTRQLEKN